MRIVALPILGALLLDCSGPERCLLWEVYGIPYDRPEEMMVRDWWRLYGLYGAFQDEPRRTVEPMKFSWSRQTETGKEGR